MKSKVKIALKGEKKIEHKEAKKKVFRGEHRVK